MRDRENGIESSVADRRTDTTNCESSFATKNILSYEISSNAKTAKGENLIIFIEYNSIYFLFTNGIHRETEKEEESRSMDRPWMIILDEDLHLTIP